MTPAKRLSLRKKSTKAVKTPDFGIPGAPINRYSPFLFGFVATVGAVSAFTLMRALASLSQIFILVISALFLAMGLNPAVESLRRRGMKRVTAVSTIFLAVIAFLIFFGLVIIPPVINQGSALISNLPQLIDNLKHTQFINDLNNRYHVIDQLNAKVQSLSSNGSLVISAFGGVVGVGRTVVSGIFTTITILILTLYFTTSLPQAIDLGLKFVPASRRDRVRRLTEAVVGHIGTFVGSQIIIAALAAIFISILGTLLGLPSSIAIGMTIFICALVPLIGHYLGITIATVIGLTQSVTIGIIVFVSYVLYVQVENYLITPRIMKRTLSVPGVVTLLSAMVGSSLLGLIGGLLAVPVAASVILILDEVVFPRTNAE